MKLKSTNDDDASTTHEEPIAQSVEISPGKEKPRKLGRRQFIVAGTGAAAAIITTSKALAQSSGHTHGGSAQTSGNASGKPPKADSMGMGGSSKRAQRVHLTTFPQPQVLTAVGGVLEETLNVAMLSGTQIRAYNGNAPGPTFRVSAGDALRILVNNRLPPNPPPPTAGATSVDYCNNPKIDSNPHCFNSTNLHTHGLHVSPETANNIASDDVLIEIDPGKSQQYCIQLPTFHAPGTHWYHAHKHGAAAIQIAQGLAGVLIVQDPPTQPVLPFAHADYVWLMQEILTGKDAQLIYTRNAQASEFYINGQFQPTLTMQQGEIQRWRFVNGTGTPRGLSTLALVSSPGSVPQTMNMIARDGILFYGKAPQPITSIDFSPGQRIDFLVQINTPGTYQVMKNAFPANWGAPGVTPQVLATVVVQPSPLKQVMPTVIKGTPPAYLRPITQYTPNAQTVTLTAFGPGTWGSPCTGPAPTAHPAPLVPTLNVVNCKEYDPNEIMFQPKLNTTEEWVLQNGANTSAHPFHIHVNPFQVEHMLVDPKGPDNATNWMWLDTVPVLPPNAPAQPWFVNKQTRILSRFLNYPGEFVLHCHLLTHEDMGLMANVKVIDDGTGIGPCVKI